MEKKYIICIFKNGDRIVQLHSNKHFYNSTFDIRGCHPVEYKIKSTAEKHARRYAGTGWGPAFTCTYGEMDCLNNAIYNVYGEEKRKRFNETAANLSIELY